MAKYPSNKISIIPFLSFLQSGVKNLWGYIMASYCQKPTSLSSWYFTQYKNSSAQYRQALYWKKNAPIVADCNGLVEGYLTKTLGYTVNERARNNYWAWCPIKGKIKTLQKTPGAAVFMANSGTDTMHHVGYLICPTDRNKPNGDWWVVEARGVMYGVKKYKLSERPWSHWGLMTKFFTYDCTPEQAYDLIYGTQGPTNPLPTDPIYAKYGDKKSTKVKEVQTLLKKLGDSSVGAIDGDFGKLTLTAVKRFQKNNDLTVDGVVYTSTYNKMVMLANGEKIKKIVATGDRVNIRFEPNTSSSILKVVLKNEKFDKGTDETPDWYGIMIDSKTYWISKKFSKEE